MRTLSILTLAVLLSLATDARADVQLTFADGRVSLKATNATIRQILEEWARVGQIKIVNAERVAGAPVTMELTNEPEEKALEIVLRSVSGYLAAPRPSEVANASRFDRIVVMPTSTAPRAAPPPPPPAFPQPAVRQAPPEPADDAEGEEQKAVPNARMPQFPTFPQPQVVNPPQGVPPPPVAYPTPTAPIGVSRPGMIVPPPPQPGQEPQPLQRPPDDVR